LILQEPTYAEIASSFGVADHSIPLTLLFKWIAENGGLSELAMRAPSLIFGIALLVVLPALFRASLRDDDGSTPAYLAVFLAFSPVLVFYSRLARPYSASLFLTLVAILSFHLWWTRGKRRWAVAYVASSMLAPCLHLSSAFAVLTPLAFGFSSRFFAPGKKPGWVGLTIVSATVIAGWALFLLPPLLSDASAITRKIGESGDADIQPLVKSLALIAGTADPRGMAVLAILCVAGLARLLVRSTGFAAYLLTIVVAQVAGVLLLDPAGIENGIVVVRYCLVIVPVLLLFASHAIARMELELHRRIRPYPRGALTVLVAAFLVGVGPLPRIYGERNDFTNHYALQQNYDPAAYPDGLPKRIPEFYAALRGTKTRAIVEAPYSIYGDALFAYQEVHRKRVIVGFVGDEETWSRPGEYPIEDSRFAFDNVVHVSRTREIRSKRVRWVVFHKDLAAELVEAHLPAEDPGATHRWIEHYRTTVGPPRFEDEDIVVFDLREIEHATRGNRR